MNAGYNPFAPFDLRLPEMYKDQLDGLVRQGVRNANARERPFARQVDLWNLAIDLAVATEAEPGPISNDGLKKFVTGVVLQRDTHRIALLEFLGIAHSGDHSIVNRPKEVVDIANAYAAAGLPLILDRVAQSTSDPLWQVLDLAFDHATRWVGEPKEETDVVRA